MPVGGCKVYHAPDEGYGLNVGYGSALAATLARLECFKLAAWAAAVFRALSLLRIYILNAHLL